MKPKITYNIIEEIGIIDTVGDWTMEVNLVSWNGGEPKIDIRSWAPDKSKSSKIARLTHEQAESLAKILTEYLNK